MQTHIYLVSDEPTANISPAIDHSIRPDKIILMTSPEMQQYARWLKSVLQDNTDLVVVIKPLDDAWDFMRIREQLLQVIADHADGSLSLNVSCGTRPMTLAAFEVFREAHLPIFFVRSRQDQLIWAYPDKSTHNLADKIKLKPFLQAHGTAVESWGSHKTNPAWIKLGHQLIDHIDLYSKHIATINYHAQRDEGRLISSTLHDKSLAQQHFVDLLALFEKAGVFKVTDNHLVFANESSRFFANGGWLEQIVFSEIQALAAKESSIQDIAQSLEVLREGQSKPVRNELDVVTLCNNKLYIIECKTKRFKSIKHADSPGAETLYKIDTLQDVFGGLNASGMLISYLKFSDYDMSRANDLGIAVCQHSELQNLSKTLRTWMNLKA